MLFSFDAIWWEVGVKPGSYIVIKSAQHFEAIDAPTVSFLIGGCPAEGLFGVEEDKMTLGEVLAKFLKLIIWHHLQNGNLLAYRT